MKKLTLFLSMTLIASMTFAQSLEDMALQAACDAVDTELKPLLKAKDHPKKSLKSSTWTRLGDAYVNSANACKKDSTAANKALDAYTKALEIEGEDGKATASIKEKATSEALGNAFMNQGVFYYNANNLVKAAEDFTMSMDINKTDTLAAFYAGIASQQSENIPAAKRALGEYIERGGGDVVAYYSLASYAQQEEDYDEAIRLLKEASTKFPNDSELKSTLINIYLTADKVDDAIADLEKLSKEDPTNTTNLTNLGILYDNKGDKDKAISNYKKVLEIEPGNFDTNFNMGVFYFNEGVNIKKEVDAMDMATYRKEGKAVEDKVCEQFMLAKGYFDAADNTKAGDPEVTRNLKNINNVLSHCGDK